MFRRLIGGAAVLLVALFGLIGTDAIMAGAQEIENDATAVAPTAALTLSAFTVLIVTSLLIPVATGLLTKAAASATVHQIVTAVISTIAGIITTSTQLDGTAVISLTTVQYAGLAFLIATAGYLGIYRPHDTNAKLVPEVGFG